MNDNAQRAQFERDGFFVCENILDTATVDSLNHLSDTVLAEQDAEHFERQRATGSMVLIDWAMAYEKSAMGELITQCKALDALAQLGFTEPKFGHGRIISKPPHSPPLFWHEDGRFWDDPVSYTPQPIQVFLMYYLTDTTPKNGCLRVIPGSHLTRHALHDQISPQHTESLTTYADPSDPGFCKVDEEIDVPVKAGDLVIGYGSLLHASHGNRS
ncbi:MAG: phytanoyl-CoA dioxygenase, partial [Gemmatimonadetes bacterium]|nr:phytanoyl-CoA dioxygenase [Gemmatimonadota bacterium]